MPSHVLSHSQTIAIRTVARNASALDAQANALVGKIEALEQELAGTERQRDAVQADYLAKLGAEIGAKLPATLNELETEDAGDEKLRVSWPDGGPGGGGPGVGGGEFEVEVPLGEWEDDPTDEGATEEA